MFKSAWNTLMLMLFAGQLFGDGIIIPEPPPHPSPLPVPENIYLNMPEHFASVRIKENVARVSVSEVFENPHPFEVEGDYIFPLPKDAAISNFSIVVDGKELVGKVMEREKAREIYMEYVRRKLDPALLEYMDDNLFRARVFPIQRGKSVRVNIHYDHVLRLSNGLYKFEYPLKIDALTKDPIGRITISIVIESKDPIKSVFSPSHTIETEWVSDNRVKVTFKSQNYRPESDFVLYYSVSRNPFDMTFLTYRKPGEDGFFMLTISPGKQPRNLKPVPKDIIFVFDVSGSMSGEKIEQAVEGLEFMLHRLNPGDRFNIIAFNDELSLFRESLVEAAHSQISAAVKFVQDFEAGGSTNISEALDSALSMLRSGDGTRAKYILFLTDGQPTVGETDPGLIIKAVRKKLNGTKIFVFGVGYDVNTKLLDRLAEISNGQVEYIEPGGNIERAITSLYRMIKSPALIDVRLTIRGVKTKFVYPSPMPDIYYGHQLVVTGRYSGSGRASVVLTGKDPAGNTVTYTRTVIFPSNRQDYPFVPRLWARRRIGYLLAMIDENGETDELVDEVIRLGEKYGIVTPYTSFLVEGEEELPPPPMTSTHSSGSRFHLKLPHLGRPLKGIQAGAASPPAGPDTMAAQVPSAVSFTRSKKKAQYLYSQQVAEEYAGESSQSTYKVAGDKTFRYDPDKGIWIDTDYDSTKCRKLNEIEYGSDQFIKLLEKHPELAIYMSVSKNLIIVIDDSCYRIKE